ncbi:hypothetical protein LUZ63_001206 [Rhynchospora breviuscula]|uniref:Leucine-rich repeat-containing N-terminal plant-type domain-containing protein n=1 Tax=Rhynchospora breviuscula TaxID=2022672 RepID=A0A9Q0HWU5_9POAL|nr:hypothetical protein LUZ63_001206 [Rhynchospora breviuscula]
MSIIFFVLFLLCCTSSVLSVKDDEKVLLKIKKQLGDPDSLSWWVKGFDYCDASANTGPDFSYITCTDTGRVRSILLQNLNVNAPFPDAICDLTDVQDLLLNNDPGLYGPIPSCITQLSNLWEVIITDTSFSGPVPSFYNNPNLLFINLASNHLSGTIPSSFSALPKLISLDLSGNYLTGSIPPQLVHTSSPSLVLSNNSLTGELPKCYGWVDFSVIDVGGNQLIGDASFLFGRQKKAVNIVLANNEFEFDLSNLGCTSLIYRSTDSVGSYLREVTWGDSVLQFLQTIHAFVGTRSHLAPLQHRHQHFNSRPPVPVQYKFDRKTHLSCNVLFVMYQNKR